MKSSEIFSSSTFLPPTHLCYFSPFDTFSSAPPQSLIRRVPWSYKEDKCFLSNVSRLCQINCHYCIANATQVLPEYRLMLFIKCMIYLRCNFMKMKQVKVSNLSLVVTIKKKMIYLLHTYTCAHTHTLSHTKIILKIQSWGRNSCQRECTKKLDIGNSASPLSIYLLT